MDLSTKCGGGLSFIPPVGRNKRIWDFSAPSNLYVLGEQPRLYEKAIDNPQYAERLEEPLARAIRKSLDRSTLHFRPPLRMVDLGPGYPSKSVPVVLRIKRAIGRLSYSPVDVSPMFLKLACKRMSAISNVSIEGHLQLFDQLTRDSLETDRSVQLVISIGPTFMNFPGKSISSLLHDLTKPGDLCLICAQYRDPTVAVSDLLDPYRTSDVVRFNFSILKHLGFVVRDVSYFVRFRRDCIEMGFQVKQTSQYLRCLGFKPRDLLVTARSYRYRLGDYQDLLRSYFPNRIDTLDPVHSIVVSWCTRGK